MPSRKLLLPITVLYFLFISVPALSQTLSGKVVSIADGDTITILDSDKMQYKIRLYGIDTPEKGQAFGKTAKRHTSRLVAGKHVKVISYDMDRYGRTVGVVIVGGVNVNQSLITAGLAWQYRKYCKESFCGEWLGLEKQARNNGVGLWSDTKSVAPWEWRRAKKAGRGSSRSIKVAGGVGRYHSNKKSHVFHSSQCRHYNCKNCTVLFKSVNDAIRAGYKAHKQCVK